MVPSVFLNSRVDVLRRRVGLFAVLNLAYFSAILISALVARFLFFPPLYPNENLAVPEFFLGMHWSFMVVGIFVFNLVLSAFIVVTLPGMVFFPLSIAFLLFRAVLWGFLISFLPLWLFLAALPTLVVEGEAYVIAAVAGIAIGVSWVKPSWLFGEKKELSRREAFGLALKDCRRLYFWIALLLLVAAMVEVATLLSL